MTEHPALVAMLICELAIREEGTGRLTLIRIFDTIRLPRFPGRQPAFCVYAKVTDAQGDYSISLELVRLEDLQTIGLGAFLATIHDRLTSVECVFHLDSLTFERPGRYEFRLLADER